MARNLAFILTAALLGVVPFTAATTFTPLAPEVELRGFGVGGANYTRVCNQISGFLSAGSRVYYPGASNVVWFDFDARPLDLPSRRG